MPGVLAVVTLVNLDALQALKCHHAEVTLVQGRLHWPRGLCARQKVPGHGDADSPLSSGGYLQVDRSVAVRGVNSLFGFSIFSIGISGRRSKNDVTLSSFKKQIFDNRTLRIVWVKWILGTSKFGLNARSNVFQV